jgi:transcription initiation factor TFIIIB Brf1 subunit/transcription initiation factor TFIIB
MSKLQPAFACANNFHHQQGMTLRQYYAGLAMQGLCINSFIEGEDDTKRIVIEAIKVADALIEQLEKQDENK